MAKRYHISDEQVNELQQARRKNKDKNIDKRLNALLLHAQGYSHAEVAERTGYASTYVGVLISKYCRNGIQAIVEKKYYGNRRNMSFQEEEEFLKDYKEQASKGQIVNIADIKNAYIKKVGHSIGGSQIYTVLHRHGWRKIMPRSKHPNKASDEAIVASKKLTMSSEKSWKILQVARLD